MGFRSFMRTTAETRELHAVGNMRTRYYKTNYNKVKAKVLLHVEKLGSDVMNIDDAHGEIFIQSNKYHMIISIIQVNPIETAVDFKVEFYGLIGRNRPQKMIQEFYAYLDSELPFKGTSLHP
jgi:hypothetical protein